MDRERARRIECAVVQVLNRVGSESVASEIGVSEPTVSRLKNEHLPNLARMLVVLGFKVVPIEMQCYRPESIAAMVTLAKERMDQIKSPSELVWEDGA